MSVVGISLDEDGWKMMKPFIKTTAMPYRIALRIDDTVKQYNIENMLKTFLIDVGLVDKDDVENDIRAPFA